MNCEEISKKALELNINPEDIKIVKETYNGWRVEFKQKRYPINRVKELNEYIKTK